MKYIFACCALLLIENIFGQIDNQNIECNYSNSKICYESGENLIKEGKETEGYALIEKSCANLNPSACFKLGAREDKNKKFQIAKKHYATSCNGDIPEACHNIGVIEARLNNFQEAKKYFLLGCEKKYEPSCKNLAHLKNNTSPSIEESQNYIKKIERTYHKKMCNPMDLIVILDPTSGNTPPKNCLLIAHSHFKVFQVQKGGIIVGLIHANPIIGNRMVFIKTTNQYVDDNFLNPMLLEFDGIYQYKNAFGIEKTINSFKYIADVKIRMNYQSNSYELIPE